MATVLLPGYSVTKDVNWRPELAIFSSSHIKALNDRLCQTIPSKTFPEDCLERLCQYYLKYSNASADSETAAVPKSHSLVCKNNQSRSGEDDIGGEPWGENIFMTFRLPTD